MSYLDDLDKCMANADECIRVMEDCVIQQHHTPYAMTRDRLVRILKSVYHCLNCVKKKKDKLKADIEFKCGGGCIRPMSLTRQAAINKRMPYINHIVPELKGLFERNKDA
jgi:hypothetical protein